MLIFSFLQLIYIRKEKKIDPRTIFARAKCTTNQSKLRERQSNALHTHPIKSSPPLFSESKYTGIRASKLAPSIYLGFSRSVRRSGTRNISASDAKAPVDRDRVTHCHTAASREESSCGCTCYSSSARERDAHLSLI